MLQNSSLFAEGEVFSAYVDSNDDFVVGEIPWMTEQSSDDYLYQQIVYKVISRPKILIAHVQRIYFSYNHQLPEQMYAALIDLLIILDGKGNDLSRRLVAATNTLLSSKQLEIFEHYLKYKKLSVLTGNRFSLFTKGMVGISTLIEEQNKKVVEHDVLQIARDYIEYSQLDAALDVLEAGVEQNPERLDLQTELLELYQVTKNITAFTLLHTKLLDDESRLISGWQELSDYFSGLSDEK